MARFLAAIEGSRGEATRLGTPRSGIRAQAQGWSVGVKAYGHAYGDVDEFTIYATGGSNGGHSDTLIGRITLDDDGRPTFYPVDSTELPATLLEAIDA